MSASSYDPEILEALAEFIYENAKHTIYEDSNNNSPDGEKKLDAVVLTGDLATTGTTADIEQVSKFLGARSNPRLPHKSDEEEYRGATLSAVKVPILCLPGNHDRFIPTREIYDKKYPIFFRPGGTNFDRQLIDYRQKPIQEIEISSDVSTNRELKVVILAADFSLESFEDHEGIYGWLAQGRAYSDKRRQLVERTEELRGTKHEHELLCVIWAMHFPPYYPRYPSYGRLIGEEKIIREANRTGVSAILAGHTHEQLTYRHPGWGFWVLCSGTTTQHEPLTIAQPYTADVKDGNFFQIISITADEAGRIKLSSKDYRYSDSGDGSFPRLLTWMELPSPN